MDLLNLPVTTDEGYIIHLALAVLAQQTGEALPAAREATDMVADHRIMMLEDRLATAQRLRDWVAEMIG